MLGILKDMVYEGIMTVGSKRLGENAGRNRRSYFGKGIGIGVIKTDSRRSKHRQMISD